jgi:L-cysteine desulfidase
MKGKNNIINILKHDPNLADKWINDEKNSEYKYFKDISIKELKKIAQMPDLFSVVELDLLTPAYDCACTT